MMAVSGLTIFDRFEAACEAYPQSPFLHAPRETSAIYDLDIATYSYEDAAAEVAKLKAVYEALGVAPGARIGLAFDNRPAFFLHFLAINSLGGSILPLNSAMQPEELRYQIAHSECALIVTVDCYVDRYCEITVDIERAPAVVDAEQVEHASRLSGVAARAGGNARDQEAAILYTSGTTGKPKGCLLSNDYFLAIGDLYTGLGGLCAFRSGSDRIITPLPVTHMNALACSFMAAIGVGACLVQLDRFHPKTWWNTVRDSQATVIHYLGVMPAMLLLAPETPDDDVGEQVRFGFGAGCDPRHHARFEKRFGIPLVEAWAMTETGAGAWITAAHEPRQVGTRCFGKAPSGLECRLVDEEDRDVADGEPGELLVRRTGANPRAHFFSGYFKDEKATKDAWRGGWFHTGDVVRVDGDGHFYFVDRRKNVIRRSGENIAAIDVESVLMRHEGIAKCVVVPVPDEMRGEEVAALIVPGEESDQDRLAQSIFDFAMEQLIYFKAPGFICLVDDVPMTASEKVRRGEAKTLARELVERGACVDFTALKKRRKEEL